MGSLGEYIENNEQVDRISMVRFFTFYAGLADR